MYKELWKIAVRKISKEQSISKKVALSDKAKSIALPMLLCTEADVEGNHSTASGKVDESAVFYIMSRGLSYKEAVRLLVKANFNKIIEGIQDEEVKTEILQEIDKRL